MPKRVLVRSLLAIVFLGAGAWIAVQASEDVVVEENVTYGQVDGVELQLDLARPKTGTGPFPAVVFIHGGAWAGGERTAYRSMIEKAARRGYVAATISYRLTGFDPKTSSGKVPFPAQIHDCKCAIRWIRSAAGKYHIDPERVGVTGGSAGGHLSLLVGLVDQQAGMEGNGGHANFPSAVRAVVNYCGPTDLVQEYNDVKAVQPFLQALCGGTPDLAGEAYKIASPVTYVSRQGPPVLTVHGDRDDIVPVEQARSLDEVMKQAGAPHELLILSGQGHAFEGESGREAEKALWSFFDKHLKTP